MNFQNPQQFLQSMSESPIVKNNPLLQNALLMMQNGDAQGLENMARNICNERNIDINEMINKISKML